MQYDEFLKIYKKGKELADVNVEESILLSHLKFLKESNIKPNKRITDELKQIIAERDSHGISRNSITSELNINYNTVKSACLKYGNVIKNKPKHPQKYESVKPHDLLCCPECSGKLNEAGALEDEIFPDEVTTKYCFGCGNEFFNHDNFTYMINWEYID